MSETIVLDPSAVATGRTEFDITGLIQSAGVDWGESQIEAYMAEATRGQVPVDFRVPNRTITIPLVMKNISGLTYDQARQKMQAKVGLFHREGGWLKRVVKGTALYADVVNATLKLGGSGLQALRDFDVDATLSLECLPEFYGDEITLDDMTETTAAEMVKVLKLSAATATIKGDYPARTRIVVDDDQGQSQRGLLWGLRARYYDVATTAALAYEAEALTPLDQAVVATVSGASGGASNNVVQHAALGSNWTPVLSTDLGGTGPLTHTGSYRVFARAYSTSIAVDSNGTASIPVATRLLWGVGDLTTPVDNTAARFSRVSLFSSQFFILDMGEIRLDRATVGTHQWQGQIQAKGDVGGENISIDKVWLLPIAESAGILRSGVNGDIGLTAATAHDEFAQTSGNLTGGTVAVTAATNASPIVITATSHGLATGAKAWIEGVLGNTAANGFWTVTNLTANTFSLNTSTGNGAYTSGGTVCKPGKTIPVGGSWFGNGETGDFTLNTTAKTVERTSITDSAQVARFAVAAQVTSALGAVVQCDVKMEPSAGNLAWMGVVARYSNKGNWVGAVTDVNGSSFGSSNVVLVESTAGTITMRDLALRPPVPSGTWVTIKLLVTSTGDYSIWLYPQGGQPGDPLLIGTGLTHAAGKSGIADGGTIVAATRSFDNFAAWPPTVDAVLNASQSAELRWDGMMRENVAGTAYSPVAEVVGDLPRLPPSGIEARPVELFIKASRGDVDSLPDPAIDDISARVFYRPCWLFVPGA